MSQAAAPSTEDSRFIVIIAVLSFALGLRILGALGFVNMHYPDEIFQTVEQAHRLSTGYGIVPWEFNEGIRFWGLPIILSVPIKLVIELGGGSNVYIPAVQVLLSLLSLTIVYAAYRLGEISGGLTGGALAALLTAGWYELVYFAPKALTESVAAATLISALLLLVSQDEEERRSSGRLLSAGLLLGLTAYLRIHLAPAVALVFIWAVWASSGVGLKFLATGLVAAIGVCGVVDFFSWGMPFYSPFRNVQVNLLQGKSREWGTSPWYWYFGSLWSWPNLVFFLACLAAVRRFPLFGVAAIVVLISHAVVPHKEYRFIFPVVSLIVALGASGVGLLVSAIKDVVYRRLAFMIALSVGMTMSFLFATGEKFERNWAVDRAQLQAFMHISERSDVCGLALRDISIWSTGGYFYLHHDVPIYEATSEFGARTGVESFNYLLSRGAPPKLAGEFEFLACWGEEQQVCLLRRPGACITLEREEPGLRSFRSR